MVGFPGETEDAFNELKEFVREAKFERMGAFAYCEEDDTYAAKISQTAFRKKLRKVALRKL